MPNQPIVGFVSPPQWYDPSPTEFAKLCGDSIRVQQTIMTLPDFSYDDLDAIAGASESMTRAAQQLKDSGASIVAFNGTPFTWAGLSTENDIRARAQRIALTADCPFIMPGTAMIDALRAHGARRVAIFAPYYTNAWLEMTADAFRACHCDVVAAASAGSLGLVPSSKSIDDHAVASAPETVLEGLRRLAANHKDIDAIAIPGTGIRTLAMTASAETELKLPIIGADTATYWAVAENLKHPIRHQLFRGLNNNAGPHGNV